MRDAEGRWVVASKLARAVFHVLGSETASSCQRLQKTSTARSRAADRAIRCTPATMPRTTSEEGGGRGVAWRLFSCAGSRLLMQRGHQRRARHGVQWRTHLVQPSSKASLGMPPERKPLFPKQLRRTVMRRRCSTIMRCAGGGLHSCVVVRRRRLPGPGAAPCAGVE